MAPSTDFGKKYHLFKVRRILWWTWKEYIRSFDDEYKAIGALLSGNYYFAEKHVLCTYEYGWNLYTHRVEWHYVPYLGPEKIIFGGL